MDREQILQRLAPCGLDCSRCAGCKDGEIRALSAQLLDKLGNYGYVAGIIGKFNPLFESYDSFEGILKHFSAASCGGCRFDAAGCPVPCAAKDCHKKMGVDFCFECASFPCDQKESVPIGERWLKMNQRMKEIGIEAYYEEQLQKPRY